MKKLKAANPSPITAKIGSIEPINTCLLYTSDAADERSSVDLGGRRIIKKKTKVKIEGRRMIQDKNYNIQSERRGTIKKT